jgi:nicotinate phosphoribosyltransferase
MAQGYWKNGLNHYAVFEMFFRRHPFEGGFSVFAGVDTLLESLKTLRFRDDDLAYLEGLGLFEQAFLDYLREFRFTGSLWAVDEGTVVFPQEPLVRIAGDLIQCQIVEGLILNTVNFQSLIATKTARVWLASGKGSIMEFGLRRAQGWDGAMSASRAAFIGGASGTSNVLAGKTFGIPVMGTMAHSWIMAHDSEEAAFAAYAAMYPDRTVFLIDTYDTLKSGVLNAIKVGKHLAARGKNFGVRLDSGDMHYLTVQVRRILDEAGFPTATITVSNDLDETIIQTLVNVKAPIDFWGVGTNMVTGGNEAAFSGVYKLTARDDGTGSIVAAMKFSDNPDKTTNPGIKQVWRIKDPQGMAVADVLGLEDDSGRGDTIEPGKRYVLWHPSADYRHFYHTVEGAVEKLLKLRLDRGKPLGEAVPLIRIQRTLQSCLAAFDPSYTRILNPHIYKVSMTQTLRTLKLDLIKSHLGDL